MNAATQMERSREELAPIIVDLSEAKNYDEMMKLARNIGQWLRAMPLEGIAKMADDAARMALVKPIAADELTALRIDRDTVQVLACAQRQLSKIRERAR